MLNAIDYAFIVVGFVTWMFCTVVLIELRSLDKLGDFRQYAPHVVPLYWIGTAIGVGLLVGLLLRSWRV